MRCFSPGIIRRINEWESKKKNDLTIVQTSPCSVDLDHNVNKGNSHGPWIPTQLQHNTFMDINHSDRPWRVATGMEHFAAMGWPVFGPMQLMFGKNPMTKIFADLPIRSQKSLSGNSMHLVTQAAWMMYVLANVVPVEKFQPRRTMGSANDEWDDEVVDLADVTDAVTDRDAVGPPDATESIIADTAGNGNKSFHEKMFRKVSVS